jgi:hypothetical protein
MYCGRQEHAAFIFKAEDGDGKLHQNVYSYLSNYVVSHSELK